MDETKKIKYSFIIPVTSDPFHLKNLLESVSIQKFNPDRFEFIIVKTDDREGVDEVVNDFKTKNTSVNIVVVSSGKPSVSESRNTGIKNARGDILIFVEDDVIFEQNYFVNLVADTGETGEIFAGGGKIIPVFEQQKPPWLIKFFMPLLAEVNLKEKHKVFPAKLYPLGIHMLVHRKIFDLLGYFDPSPETKHGPEHVTVSEKKFIDKVRKAGYPVYYFANLLVWNYVPVEQVNRQYIRKQAEIALQVEIERAKQKGRVKYWRFLFREILKYIATVGIGFYYLITTQWEKLKSIFQYRYWSYKVISKSLVKK